MINAVSGGNSPVPGIGIPKVGSALWFATKVIAVSLMIVVVVGVWLMVRVARDIFVSTYPK